MSLFQEIHNRVCKLESIQTWLAKHSLGVRGLVGSAFNDTSIDVSLGLSCVDNMMELRDNEFVGRTDSTLTY